MFFYFFKLMNKVRTRAKGLMCLGQREDSEILKIIQLKGCVILIDQNGILAHDGMP